MLVILCSLPQPCPSTHLLHPCAAPLPPATPQTTDEDIRRWTDSVIRPRSCFRGVTARVQIQVARLQHWGSLIESTMMRGKKMELWAWTHMDSNPRLNPVPALINVMALGNYSSGSQCSHLQNRRHNSHILGWLRGLPELVPVKSG